MLTRNTLASALLVSLVSANPVVVRRSEPVDTVEEVGLPLESCWNQVLDSQWTVDEFDYQASVITPTVEGEQKNAWGYVAFNLGNTATSYTADCAAASNREEDGFFTGSEEYACTLSEVAPEGAAVAFKYTRATGLLVIKDTILCSEEGTTATFIAKGTTQLSLECTDETTETEEYSDRQIKCTPVDTYLRPEQVVGKEE